MIGGLTNLIGVVPDSPENIILFAFSVEIILQFIKFIISLLIPNYKR